MSALRLVPGEARGAAVREARGGTLILGGGFGGAYVARLLGSATVVSPESSLLYTPLLPEVAAGAIEPRHAFVPLRMMCPRAELLRGHASALDQTARIVTVETETGPVVLSYWRLVTGYAGVEALAETRQLVRDALPHYPALRGVRQRWVLVDAAPRILVEVPDRLSGYTSGLLQQDGVEILTSSRIASVDGSSVTLDAGRRIDTATVVWAAGVRAHPLVRAWGLPLDEDGRVVVDSSLRIPGRPDIWALGDCAAVPNAATPGRFDPPTCQHAVRQARALVASIAGDTRPYRYRSIGEGATLGRGRGIARVFGLHVRGRLGALITRGYHVSAVPVRSRRLRILADGLLSTLFRRDIAELGTSDPTPGREMGDSVRRAWRSEPTATR
jgi:NADH dehydrogenase